MHTCTHSNQQTHTHTHTQSNIYTQHTHTQPSPQNNEAGHKEGSGAEEEELGRPVRPTSDDVRHGHPTHVVSARVHSVRTTALGRVDAETHTQPPMTRSQRPSTLCKDHSSWMG